MYGDQDSPKQLQEKLENIWDDYKDAIYHSYKKLTAKDHIMHDYFYIKGKAQAMYKCPEQASV